MSTSDRKQTPRRTVRAFASVAAFVVAALPLPRNVAAQVRASERGTVSQVLDGATITVEYGRPVARGRDPLFGNIVHWDGTWTPGADWATTISADRDLRVNGQPLPKGKYSVWMIPRRTGDWTVLLSRDAHRFHVSPPDAASIQLRVPATPAERPVAEEVLTWSFPSVAPDAAVLRMQWGRVAVPIRVTVASGQLPTVRDGDRATYVGEYSLGQPNGARATLHVADEAGTLRVREDGLADARYDYFDLVPDGARRFRRALYKGGQLVEVESDVTYVFDVVGGRATGLRVYGADGQPLGRADRVQPSDSAGRR